MEKPHVLTLCMIVKNEAKNIKGTLENVVKNFNIDYWVISDTGSTDNTIDIITDTFQKLNIPGRFHNKEWKDFSTNRNYVIEEAEKESEYLLFFDADDKVDGNFCLPPKLTADSYLLKFGPTFIWHRIFIVKTNNKWRYKGILHEYITCDNPSVSRVTITGSYYIVPGTHGCRSKDPNKYYNDGLVFEKALTDSQTPKDLIPRYTYYCAQSYKDANCMDRAVEFYKKTLELNGWVQEQYIACKVLGDYYKDNGNANEAIKYYSKSRIFDPTRVDCILEMAKLFDDDKLKLSILTSIPANYVADPSRDCYLFIDTTTHNVFFFNTVIILAYKLGESKIVCDYLQEQLKRGNNISKSNLLCTVNNVELCLKNYSNRELLDVFSELNKLIFSNKKIDKMGTYYLGRDKLKEVVCSRVSIDNNIHSRKNNKSILVLFYVTTTEALKNTFYSFVNCFKDCHEVESFKMICSINQAEEIRDTYPELAFIKNHTANCYAGLDYYKYVIKLDCEYYFCHKEKYLDVFIKHIESNNCDKLYFTKDSRQNIFMDNKTSNDNSMELAFDIMGRYKRKNDFVEVDISSIIID